VGCEWSLLIQELLKVTFNKRLTARKFKAPKRGLNVGLMSFQSEEDDLTLGYLESVPPRERKVEASDYNGPNAISTLLIETDEVETRNMG